MWKDLNFHLFHGPQSDYTALFIVAILFAVQACYVDIFIDESESAPSEIANEKRGIKATIVTRPIMIAISMIIGAFSIWKIWQP